MDPLRIILLILGVLLILGIYWWSVRERRSRAGRSLSGEAEGYDTSVPSSGSPGNTGTEAYPGEGLDELEGVGEVVVRRRDEVLDTEELGPITVREDYEAVPESEALIIALNVMAPPGQPFTGREVIAAARAQGLEPGAMDIFHLYPPHRQDARPILSLANAVEPGTLDPEEADVLLTPGLLLFMRLPGPVDGRDAFEMLLEHARRLADTLGGELCDERRSVLTPQTVGHLREQIESWRFKRRIDQLRNRQS